MEAYRTRADAALNDCARLDRKTTRLSNLRLVLFLLAIAAAISTWVGWLPSVGWGAAILAFAAFIVAAVLQDSALAERTRARIRLAINQRGLARLGDDLSLHPWTGERWLDPSHPYAPDLDLFGDASLFRRLDTTGTALGEARLASWLLAPASPADATQRQRRVAALVDALDARQMLEIEARVLSDAGTRPPAPVGAKPDPSRLIAFCDSGKRLRPRLAETLFASLSPIALLLSFLAWRHGIAPGWLPLALLGVQAVFLLLVRRRLLAFMREILTSGERLERYGALFRALEALLLSSPALAPLAARLSRSGRRPSQELNRLARALSWLQLREQPLFHLPLNFLTLFDFHLCAWLGRWQRACGDAIGEWFDTLAEMEALSSLAAFAMERPDHVFPTIEDGPPHLEAVGLGHPLIPSRVRVPSDIRLGHDPQAVVITGSNMSGKTTFLRTLGVAAVMAQAGAPVCAKSLRLTPLAVATSMRVRDSLSEGVSFFLAEVKRLKLVLDACRAGPSLYLLDEALQGTNTAERQRASRSIIQMLIATGSLGAIATHDLTLTERTKGDRIANCHFADQLVDGVMSFDYRLRPGVVTSTNALTLIRQAGIPIEF